MALTANELRSLVFGPNSGITFLNGMAFFGPDWKGPRDEQSRLLVNNAKAYLDFVDSGRNANRNWSFDQWQDLSQRYALNELYNGFASGAQSFGGQQGPAPGTPIVPSTNVPVVTWPTAATPASPPPGPAPFTGSTPSPSVPPSLVGSTPIAPSPTTPGAVTVAPPTVAPNVGSNPYGNPSTGSAPVNPGTWNFGGGVRPNTGGLLGGNYNAPSQLGTAIQSITGQPWRLGGIFDGATFKPAATPTGYDNWNPNDPRSLNPGAAPLFGGTSSTTTGSSSGGTTGTTGGPGGGASVDANQKAFQSNASVGFTPRPYVDMYGAGFQNPFKNAYHQWAFGSNMQQPVTPTYQGLMSRIAALRGGSQSGGLLGIPTATPKL